MLARPPPSVNAPTFPPTMQKQSQLSAQALPSQYRSPVLPPNFQGNQQSETQSQMPSRPPLLPSNLTGNQLYPPQNTLSHPPSHSPTPSGNQEQFHSQSSPMMTNGTNQSMPPNTYLNSNSPSASTQLPHTNVTSNTLPSPSTTTNPLYQGSMPPPPPPPPSASSSSSHTGGTSAYTLGEYPKIQPAYNVPSSSFPPNNQNPIGHSTQPHYPNLSAPPTMSNNQLNGSHSYGTQSSTGMHNTYPTPSSLSGPSTFPDQSPLSGSNAYSSHPSASGPNTYPGHPPLSGLPNTYSGHPPPSGPPNTYPGHTPSSGPNTYPGHPPPSGPPNAYPGHPPSSGPNTYPGHAPPSGPGAYPGQSSLSGPSKYPVPPSTSGSNAYPGQSSTSGPSTYPGQSPLSGPNTYPGQTSSAGSGQQSRIDPNMVPNVIQVLEQSQEKVQEPFLTNAAGLLPPLAGCNFVCHDQGSCNPRFMRASTYSVPNSHDLVKQSHVPVALSISPLADLRSDELEPPLTNFGEIGPVRCHRCKAYMCSYMQFIDGGKRFLCCFCEAATDVPNEYFNHLDHSGRRVDWFQRPELCLGTYEILATKQYCKNEQWPEAPAFIFMIDVSYNSVRSGLVEYICHALKNDLLDYLPKDKNSETSAVRVGFATFDRQIHFYNIKDSLGQPQMMVVSDTEDIFVPLMDGFLCPPETSRGVINNLLDQIPRTFANAQETEIILAPVIQAGMQALKGVNRPGKMFIFSTTLPIAMAPGKLSNRDDKKLLGTEKEKTLLGPVTDVYTKLGEECAQQGCAVDLFVFPNNYIDLATIGEVSRLSGGQIYKFNYFSVESEGERLTEELRRNFQRTTGFDALMRVRTNAGIRPVDFLGNFYMTNSTEMVFGTIDGDKSVSVELKHDDKLPNDSKVFIQVALLYTSIAGQRRLRILTLALTVASTYTSLYPACDLDTIMNYTVKVAIRSVLISTPKSIKESIIAQAANMLACYRKHCAQSTMAGQLILPETLKLLPIYVASLIKSDVLAGIHTITTDDRNWLMHRLMSMDVKGTSAYLYPRIYPLHVLEENRIPPPMVRCLYERLSDSGAYVLDNGLVMYIWLGSQLDPAFVYDLFGLQTAASIQPEKCRIVEFDNPLSKNVRTLLSMIRKERNSFMKFYVIRQRDSMEPFFKNYLVEDQGFLSGTSYVDFLYYLHREIRNILQ